MHYTEIVNKSAYNRGRAKDAHSHGILELSMLFRTIGNDKDGDDDRTDDVMAENEKFRIVADVIPFGISLVSKAGMHTYINPQFTEMFGYTLEDVPYRETSFEKAYPELSYRRNAQSRRFKNSSFRKLEPKKTLILNITCRDGSVKDVRIFPVRFKTGVTLTL